MLKNASIILGTKYLFGLGLVGAISFSGVVLTSVGAGASSPSYMTTSWTPQVSPNYQGAQYWTVTRGTHVSMECWTTGPSKLGTSKWFYIASNSYPFTTGFVPANAVANQTIVGRCS